MQGEPPSPPPLASSDFSVCHHQTMPCERLSQGNTGILTVGCVAGQMPNSSWFEPQSIERDCSAAGGTSGTCLDMSAAPNRDEKQGSAFPLSRSGPRRWPAASGSELVTAALSAARLPLTASPLLPLQLKHLRDSVSLVCGGIAVLVGISTPFPSFSQTFGSPPGAKMPA